MSSQVMIAVDSSPHDRQALRLIGNILKNQNRYDVLLFHCLQPHLTRALSEGLREGHADWECFRKEQAEAAEVLLEGAKTTLTACGFPAHRIRSEYQADCPDPAREILRRAEALHIDTIVVGRRGLSPMKRLLLGSVSDKIAQYSPQRSVWVIDNPLVNSNKVLLALDCRAESRTVATYAAQFLSSAPDADFTLLHLIAPLPPMFWDEGRILDVEELKQRMPHIAEWESKARGQVNEHLERCHNILVAAGIAPERVHTLVQPVHEGITRDILDFAAGNQIGTVVIGKKSLAKKKPFFLGSHAHKLLQYSKGIALCLVDEKGP
ncbi:MAG: hypothetical protein AUK55_03180 [Syntrophobacteraceae bacterium CG2_30_61_12]|nr:MAG: hypothetical protein AUK55_03180 [Syntrophobacteraceae bacterium CG2_30_61_12]